MEVDELPVPEARAMLATGATVSSVKLSVPVPVLPARSVWVAVNVCAPSASPAGVKLQAPVVLAVVVPRTVLPSLMVTAVLASPVPLIVEFQVILSVAELPVSEKADAQSWHRPVERKAQRRRAGITGQVGLSCGQRM